MMLLLSTLLIDYYKPFSTAIYIDFVADCTLHDLRNIVNGYIIIKINNHLNRIRESLIVNL